MTLRVQEQGAVAVPPMIAKILAGRGMAEEDVQRFLYPDYARDLHDPFLLLDMEPAVQRIIRARDNSERVIVYGDYDIDGITASGVMLEALAANGIEATSYIPDRFEEGYGINQDALEKLQSS
jgi:single-stranded-DNA-specific exonuclease